jgi:hypothetical protein
VTVRRLTSGGGEVDRTGGRDTAREGTGAGGERDGTPEDLRNDHGAGEGERRKKGREESQRRAARVEARSGWLSRHLSLPSSSLSF